MRKLETTCHKLVHSLFFLLVDYSGAIIIQVILFLELWFLLEPISGTAKMVQQCPVKLRRKPHKEKKKHGSK
jgi:hypothetical protein